ncbi:unnamed protein product [Closterium sp. Naga37s-1]|nr:unnamed protein product [Closterium sp. Naga37s-1]
MAPPIPAAESPLRRHRAPTILSPALLPVTLTVIAPFAPLIPLARFVPFVPLVPLVSRASLVPRAPRVPRAPLVPTSSVLPLLVLLPALVLLGRLPAAASSRSSSESPSEAPAAVAQPAVRGRRLAADEPQEFATSVGQVLSGGSLICWWGTDWL